LTSALIMPSPVAQALSLFQSILLSLGQSIAHDNVLYISNYYIINRFNPAKFLCLSETRTWISNIMSRSVLCSMTSGGFMTTYAISAYHHSRNEFESRSWRGVPNTTLCDKVSHCLAAGWSVNPSSSDSSTNKTILLNIVESGVKHHNLNPFCWNQTQVPY
jgi:hypothetical protein